MSLQTPPITAPEAVVRKTRRPGDRRRSKSPCRKVLSVMSAAVDAGVRVPSCAPRTASRHSVPAAYAWSRSKAVKATLLPVPPRLRRA